MANTPSFNWETPDDTDLVKDGAAAIRTLGNAIDSSMTDLKGGTTGQVLSKASNTDMDFTWVEQDDSNAIQNAIVDAKGDLITATAADTPARLASSGVSGDVLTVDTTTATGLKWAAAGGGKVKQIISATTTTATTIASTTFTDTTITATITPTSASNKILVLVSAHYYHSRSAVESAMGGRLLRGATVIANFDNELNQIQITGATAVSGRGNAPIIWLDSPATTSATTYKVQGNVGNTANSGTCTYQFNSLPSSIILLEVEA